ncbi:transporter [Ganoderma sinense ZZ0214-1]|uniref:Transporter n=1 Tax=Ganoderma sinense ZZ0214-1 TaxID=1077348 RepID=A0A2G8RWT5_9APHY|nr:transporter [Ganoderma sinense ZZ0214-1]
MSFPDLQDKLDDAKFTAPTVDVLDATDDGFLEQMGYKQEFRRDFTFLGLFSLVSSELAILPGVAGTIWYTMGYMGLVGMTWGWFVAAVMGQKPPPIPTTAQFLAYSLAELSSAYPTSGGLYYWAYMTAPPKYKMLSCYVVAWSMIISTPLACVSITYSAYNQLDWPAGWSLCVRHLTVLERRWS